MLRPAGNNRYFFYLPFLLTFHSGTGLKLFPANTAALPPVFFKNHFKEKISPPAAAAGFCGIPPVFFKILFKGELRAN